MVQFVVPAQSTAKFAYASKPAGLVNSKEFLKSADELPSREEPTLCRIVSAFFPFVLYFGEKFTVKLCYRLSLSACRKLEFEMLSAELIGKSRV